MKNGRLISDGLANINPTNSGEIEDKVSSNYPRLKFFCDWVVHGGLAGKEASVFSSRLTTA